MLKAFKKEGVQALADQKRGPKTNRVRSEKVIGQIIRLRFLDSDAGAEVIAQKLRQMGMTVSVRSVERTITQYGLQKKLHQFNPDETVPVQIQSTKRRCKTIRVSSRNNERYVREILAGKISGTHLGLWLLIPEYLRLGVWDLLQGTFGQSEVDWSAPRIALQMVGESALCVNRLRRKGSFVVQSGVFAGGRVVVFGQRSKRSPAA